MRRLFIYMLCAMLLNVMTFSVSAHPGRTDTSGGHRDYSTGEYHYHHGYSAHSHYDINGDGIIDCPYDFDDQSGSTSGGSGTNNRYSHSPSTGNIHAYRDAPLITPPTTVVSSQPDDTVQSPVSSNNTFHLSIEKMVKSILLIALALFIGGPVALCIYCMAMTILRVLFSWLWKLLIRSLSEDENYSLSLTSANIVLCIVLYILFLPHLVEMLTKSPDTLAAVIVILGVVTFIIVYVLIKKTDRNDTQATTIHKLQNECADLKRQLSIADAKALASETKWKGEANLISMRTTEIIALKNAEIEDLHKQVLSLQSQSEKNTQNQSREKLLVNTPSSHALEIPDNIYFVNGNVPVKGVITSRKPFGDFTVFVAHRGKKYHTDPYCGGSLTLEPVHLYDVLETKSACTKCAFSYSRGMPSVVPAWYCKVKSFHSGNIDCREDQLTMF